MKPLLLAGLMLTACPAATAQADAAPWKVEGPVDLFTTDELGNLYILRGNDLELYDRQGRRSARNSLNTFGPITGIDAFSSLKPMIFSAAQGQLALLDNTLSLQAPPTDLMRSGRITLACTSVQSRFWLFDERELSLKRVDGQMNETASTGRLDQLLGFTPQPTYMEEAEGRLYVVDPAHGTMVFDLFGTFIRTLRITGVERVQVRDGSLWYVRQGKLERYDLRAYNSEEVPWPGGNADAPVRDARIEQGRIYRQTNAGVEVEPLGP
ncbi:MAG TPA: hypothetical protein PKD45_08280 [Flavobacteriales bacterium]|nr:hypothetical protein [Flavobacteriales bacterium]